MYAMHHKERPPICGSGEVVRRKGRLDSLPFFRAWIREPLEITIVVLLPLSSLAGRDPETARQL
jgi:hypothetical protein